MAKEIDKIKENILKNMQINTDKTTMNTPFGGVYKELKHIQHILPMKKGEILAQVIHKKTGSRREEFVWMGIVEKSEYNPVWMKYNIFYRPFCDQLEKFNERREYLFRKQWRNLK
jgi:hypothetical protein